MSGMIIIYGAGGHGHDIADVVLTCGWDHVLYVDDDPNKGVERPSIVAPGGNYLIGVADPHVRASLDSDPNYAGVFVHESVNRYPDAQDGSVVGAGTTIGPDVTLGRHSHIGAGCTLTRTTIGDYCQIAPGVDIAGDVTIGDRVFVGVGATIANLVTIGDDAVVGAGAVVLHDVPAGATVAGVPAKVIKRRVAA